MSRTQELLQYLLSGASIGSIYAMVALGFNLIYNTTHVINFAQGEFVMLGGMLCAFLWVTLGFPLLVAIGGGVVATSLVGILLERVAIAPRRHTSILTLIIITIGASVVLKGGAMFTWGKAPLPMPEFVHGEPVSIFGARLAPQTLVIFGALVLVAAAASVFFQRTMLGKAMRACAFNPTACALMGINVQRPVLLSFALSAAIGAIGGAAVAPIALVAYDRGELYGLKGFAAAVVGGLGSYSGSIAGGLLLGVIESLTAGLVSSSYKDAVAMVALLVVLFLRPRGLLGRSEVGKLSEF